MTYYKKMNNTLNEFKVTDRQSFMLLIGLLRQDLIDHPEGWKNKTLPDFLEALSSYTGDIQGYYDNTTQNVNADIASWATFADMFKGAKVYE